MTEFQCATFDEAVGELVLDLLEPADHDRLLRHASECPRCQAELQSLTAVADLLPSVAPECEPPMGFESRVLTAITPAAVSPRHQHAARHWLAVAAAVLLAAGGGGWIGHVVGSRSANRGSAVGAPSTGTLTAADGTEHGWVVLTTGDRPMLTMHLGNLEAGTYRCLVESADGTATQVAAWPVAASGSGDWTVDLPPGHDTVRVVVLSADGTAVASAALTSA